MNRKRDRQMKTKPKSGNSSMNDDQFFVDNAHVASTSTASSSNVSSSESSSVNTSIKVPKPKRIYTHRRVPLNQSIKPYLRPLSDPSTQNIDESVKENLIMTAAETLFLKRAEVICSWKYPDATHYQKTRFLGSMWKEMNIHEKHEYVAQVTKENDPDSLKYTASVNPLMKHLEKFPDYLSDYDVQSESDNEQSETMSSAKKKCVCIILSEATKPKSPEGNKEKSIELEANMMPQTNMDIPFEDDPTVNYELDIFKSQFDFSDLDPIL